MTDYGVDSSLVSDSSYGLSDLSSTGVDYGNYGDWGASTNSDWGVGGTYDTADFPTDWYLDSSGGADQFMTSGQTVAPQGSESILSQLGSGVADAGSKLWSGLSSVYDTPFGKQLTGLGLNYLMNNIGQNKSGSSPDYKPMQSPTQYYNDPYTQAMMAETSKQVMNSGAAKGVTNPNRLATMVADKAYATNLLPYMQLQAGVNQGQNNFNMQGWAANAQQNQNLYGGLGTGLQGLMNNEAQMDIVDQLVAKVLGGTMTPTAKKGSDDAKAGLPPQSNDPEYMKAYNAAKQIMSGA